MAITVEQSKVMVEVLKKTRGRLETGWTKHRSAADSWGTSVSYISSTACSFCLTGALAREAHDMSVGTFIEARILDTLQLLTVVPVTHFNDSQETVEPVLNLVDRTIEAIEYVAANPDMFEQVAA